MAKADIMTNLVVTTADDIVDANDGKLSLREAVAAAKVASENSEAASVITFDGATFASKSTIQLHQTLTIDAGTNVIIDGTRSTATQVWLSSDGTGFGELMRVSKGAIATVRDLKLTANQFEQVGKTDGSAGSAGVEGDDGVDGNYVGKDEHSPVPTDGTAASDGLNGGDAVDGYAAVGGINNAGSLTLERVSFSNMRTKAEAGGDGGDGGLGGYGGEGGRSAFELVGANPNFSAIWKATYAPADGGRGGDGGNGGEGGDGGNAAAGILNTGSLILRDVEFAGLQATGGQAGNGGFGGKGGKGGAPGGWDTDTHRTDTAYLDMDKFAPPVGGDGGNAGLGGSAGNGGYAASALLNLGGTVVFDGVQTNAVISSAKAGTGAYGLGDHGPGTGGSVNSSYEGHDLGYIAWPGEITGEDGTGDHPEVRSADGVAGDFVGVTTANTANSSFVVRSAGSHVAEGKYATFTIARIGDLSAVGQVNWKITFGDGVNASDFKDLKTSGTATFAQGSNVDQSSYVYALTLDDGIKEGVEDFTITLTGASGGAVGWSNSIRVTIDDGQIVAPDPINGTSKSDTHLEGTAGDDTINGLKGNDTLIGGAGADKLNGGAGSDTASYATATAFVTVSLAQPGLNSGDAEGDTFLGIENIIGSKFSDTLIGNGAANLLNDGGGANDILQGLGGNDTYIVRNGQTTVSESSGKAAGTADTIKAGVSYTLAAGVAVERMMTTNQAGTDKFDLTGNAFSQIITGNNGANSINGGAGADILTGRGGADTFVFSDSFEAGVDKITDMTHDVDVIQLSKACFGMVGTINKALAANAFWASTAGTAHDGSDRIIYDTGSGKLFYDADGNKAGGLAAIEFGVVGTGLKLDSGDFFIIA